MVYNLLDLLRELLVNLVRCVGIDTCMLIRRYNTSYRYYDRCSNRERDEERKGERVERCEETDTVKQIICREKENVEKQREGERNVDRYIKMEMEKKGREERDREGGI